MVYHGVGAAVIRVLLIGSSKNIQDTRAICGLTESLAKSRQDNVEFAIAERREEASLSNAMLLSS
jgi:hypothetical protein